MRHADAHRARLRKAEGNHEGDGGELERDTVRGKLQRAEVPNMPTERFALIDANKDGGLTKQEMADAHAKKAAGHGGRRFERMDENGDGKVTKAEAEAGVKKMFEHKDANHDGAITRDEMGRGSHGHGEGKGKGKTKA